MKKYLALKIDVDTYRGTQEGVPRLVALLQKYQAQATFFFSLGPDNTGRAIKRVFRPGFIGKVSRTSVVEHYGVKTLLYGTLLPAPDISRRCADILREVRHAGFEVGIHCYDHIRWQDYVANKNESWTRCEIDKAAARFQEVFGVAADNHAAAGWQINKYALRRFQQLGFRYSSDSRGTHPFIPVCQGESIPCPQLPTTLPTLDELMNRDGITLENVAQHILHITKTSLQSGHVFTLHAELEGAKWMPIFEQLLQGWQMQGYQLVSMAQYLDTLDIPNLPHHELVMKEVDGRVGTLACQGAHI